MVLVSDRGTLRLLVLATRRLRPLGWLSPPQPLDAHLLLAHHQQPPSNAEQLPPSSRLPPGLGHMGGDNSSDLHEEQKSDLIGLEGESELGRVISNVVVFMFFDIMPLCKCAPLIHILSFLFCLIVLI